MFQRSLLSLATQTKILIVEEISGINIKKTTEGGENGGAARTGNYSLKYESTGICFFSNLDKSRQTFFII